MTKKQRITVDFESEKGQRETRIYRCPYFEAMGQATCDALDLMIKWKCKDVKIAVHHELVTTNPTRHTIITDMEEIT